MSEYNIQMNKYNALNAGYDQLYPQPMKHANTHAKDGSDPITPADIGAYTEAEVNSLLAAKQDASSAINTGNIGSQSVNYANSAGSAPANGGTAAKLGRDGNAASPMTFYWNGQGGQPSWLWGGNDGTNTYVYNPSNFNVNYANGAGNADTVDGWHMNLAYNAYGIKPICAGTGGMTSGATGLSNGHVYLQFE